MNDTAKRSADELTEKAISEASCEDFRTAYRDRLRWLKDNNAPAFARALSYYNDILVANVANGSDPIGEWIEYGRQLGNLTAAGKVMRIDETGRAHTYEGAPGGLILHLPEDTAASALALAVPKQMTDAQRATYELLLPRSRMGTSG